VCQAGVDGDTNFVASSARTSKQRRDSFCAPAQKAGTVVVPQRRATGPLTLGLGSISVTKIRSQMTSAAFATAALRAGPTSGVGTATGAWIGSAQARKATFA
jgi:hypothetical protein